MAINSNKTVVNMVVRFMFVCIAYAKMYSKQKTIAINQHNQLIICYLFSIIKIRYKKKPFQNEKVFVKMEKLPILQHKEKSFCIIPFILTLDRQPTTVELT